MKKIILYIDNMNRGGAQRVMSNLADYFAGKGEKVILVNDYPADGKRSTYEISNPVERVYLRNSYTKDPIANSLGRATKLRSLIKREAPDVVLSFLGGPNIRMLVAAVGLKVKKIVSVRNDPNKEYGTNPLKKAFVRKLFARADGCVFQTEDAAQYFSPKARAKSVIIYNPVAESFLGVNRAEDSKNIITVGRMSPQKNHLLLINAFAEIADEFPDERLIIYGDGPLREVLKKRVKELRLEERVLMPGNILNVEEALSKAKAFVLSSDYEGMPNALMEAMAAGVPCISTDCPCGGPRMLIQNEVQGMLVPCRAKEALANALRKVISDIEYQRMASKAAKKRAADFMPDKVFEQWNEFLF